MTVNPDCTVGWADRLDGGVTAFCGCGWERAGFPSRSRALEAQKQHRFPGDNPRENAALLPPEPGKARGHQPGVGPAFSG